MPTFSANLGFLWTDRPLAEAIQAAHRAGFDAVECHFPYAEPINEVTQALEQTGLPMLGLNTVKGPQGAGMAALPEAIDAARKAIDEAIDYGSRINAQHVHVMAGQTEGQHAENTYLDNLKYASDRAHAHGMGILIEPLNAFDVPGYFLHDTAYALELLDTVDRTNVRLMFDCYHVGRTEGDVTARFDACFPSIGHIQFASVPDRGPPDRGTLDYLELFKRIDESGWAHPLGAEYRVDGRTEATLAWLKTFQAHRHDS